MTPLPSSTASVAPEPDAAQSAATGVRPVHAHGWLRLWPQTLFARVTVIFVVGLAIAQALTFTAISYERESAMRDLMMSGIEQDIASSIAILDRLPAAERASWLHRLERRNYRFVLGGSAEGGEPRSQASRQFA